MNEATELQVGLVQTINLTWSLNSAWFRRRAATSGAVKLFEGGRPPALRTAVVKDDVAEVPTGTVRVRAEDDSEVDNAWRMKSDAAAEEGVLFLGGGATAEKGLKAAMGTSESESAVSGDGSWRDGDGGGVDAER